MNAVQTARPGGLTITLVMLNGRDSRKCFLLRIVFGQMKDDVLVNTCGLVWFGFIPFWAMKTYLA
jgi:hypothetical protein